jgi:ubiquinone/menaquinone biosynthesis C-methylase UbiE
MTDPRRIRTIDEVYGSAFAQYDEFEHELDRSLGPRGFDLLFDLVAGLDLPPGSVVLDVGCREAFHCIELARRYSFAVHGIDPVRLHLDGAAHALHQLRRTEPDVAARVAVTGGLAEQLPERAASLDLIWCRDVLPHVADLDAAFAEFRRVLRPGGHVIIYQMTATDWLTPAEADRLWPALGIHAASVTPARFEAAIAAGGLTVDQRIELQGEWRERSEEDQISYRSSRQLLHASRLLRNRRHYQEKFGTAAYEAMLGNSLWGVYQMIGKLNPRIYVLSRSRG